jgi:hypothetical protein
VRTVLSQLPSGLPNDLRVIALLRNSTPGSAFLQGSVSSAALGAMMVAIGWGRLLNVAGRPYSIDVVPSSLVGG